MNHDEWETLTDDEKRIKVARLCGWERKPSPRLKGPDGQWPWVNAWGAFAYDTWALPDYLNDLNAMHEAVDSIGIDGEDFAVRLWQLVCAGKPLTDRAAMLMFCNATAAQRAEAFVAAMTQGD